jgi:hypothetical protein
VRFSRLFEVLSFCSMMLGTQKGTFLINPAPRNRGLGLSAQRSSCSIQKIRELRRIAEDVLGIGLRGFWLERGLPAGLTSIYMVSEVARDAGGQAGSFPARPGIWPFAGGGPWCRGRGLSLDIR